MKKQSIETFRRVGSYDLNGLTSRKPSCCNGIVRVTKIRVTIEDIEEPKEVIQERIKEPMNGVDVESYDLDFIESLTSLNIFCP